MTRGLPASGKSTAAIELVNSLMVKRVNKDSLRAMLDNGIHSKANERFVVKVRDLMVEEALRDGWSVIVDDTNFGKKHEARLRELASKYGAGFEVKDFTDVDLPTCIERDALREAPVGEDVVRRMWRENVYPEMLKAYQDEHSKLPANRQAIVCDLDGTLCDLNGRNPYNASTCEDDLLIEPVKMVIDGMRATIPGLNVICFSGRMNTYQAETERWLEKHGIDPSALFMRHKGDNRPDNVVKKEMYHAHLKGRYNVLFVLDDRQQVVDMWRSLGIRCFQTAPGDF